jgi:hypothetical protein
MKCTHAAVLDVLTRVGPLTAREVAEFFPGTSAENVSAVISTLRNLATPRVHIRAWTRDNGHGKVYLRAVYAAGDGPEARKPRPYSHRQRCAKWRAKQRQPAVAAANSVWTWRPAA